MRMRFNVEEARNHLIERGYVYTLREWGNYPDIVTACFNNQLGELVEIGKLRTKKIQEIWSVTDLELCGPSVYEHSGFKSVKLWWNAAKGVHRRVPCYYLYLVRNVEV